MPLRSSSLVDCFKLRTMLQSFVSPARDILDLDFFIVTCTGLVVHAMFMLDVKVACGQYVLGAGEGLFRRPMQPVVLEFYATKLSYYVTHCTSKAIATTTIYCVVYAYVAVSKLSICLSFPTTTNSAAAEFFLVPIIPPSLCT